MTDEGEVKVSTELDARYSLTNGRFTFQRPSQIKDAGDYYCVAQNKFGSIRSHPVRVSFGCKCRVPKIVYKNLCHHAIFCIPGKAIQSDDFCFNEQLSTNTHKQPYINVRQQVTVYNYEGYACLATVY